MRRPAWLALCSLACSGDEVHPCDEGTPTCQSSLVVLLPDERVTFTLTLDDGQGLDITVGCPDPDAGMNVVDGYTLTCGAGRLTIETNTSFGDTVIVQLEESVPETHEPNYQKGGDFCGNPCTIGTIQL